MEMSTDARVARLAARRARVMAFAGRVVDPLARLMLVKPEALAPNNLWALTGRRLVREAIASEQPAVVVATSPPVSALFATVTSDGKVRISEAELMRLVGATLSVPVPPLFDSLG